MKEEKHCRDCFYCIVKLKAPSKFNSGRKLAETDLNLFNDLAVRNISCALGFWTRDFGSMKVFEESTLPAVAAEHCSMYNTDDE